MSTMYVLLMKLKYALSDSQKWREHVSYDCTGYEMELRTGAA